MPKNFTFDDKLVLKTINDDFNFELCGGTMSRYRRKIRPAAYAKDAMESLATSFRFELANTARIINEDIERYTNHFKVKGNPKEILSMIDADISEWKETDNVHYYGRGYLIDNVTAIASNLRLIIKECDKINEFTQMAYRVSEQKDHRFNDITAKDILVDNEAVFGNMFKEIEKQVPENIDVYSQEYGKIVCKKVKAFKAMAISTINKYFGKNSKLADLGIFDIAIS